MKLKGILMGYSMKDGSPKPTTTMEEIELSAEELAPQLSEKELLEILTIKKIAHPMTIEEYWKIMYGEPKPMQDDTTCKICGRTGLIPGFPHICDEPTQESNKIDNRANKLDYCQCKEPRMFFADGKHWCKDCGYKIKPLKKECEHSYTIGRRATYCTKCGVTFPQPKPERIELISPTPHECRPPDNFNDVHEAFKTIIDKVNEISEKFNHLTRGKR